MHLGGGGGCYAAVMLLMLLGGGKCGVEQTDNVDEKRVPNAKPTNGEREVGYQQTMHTRVHASERKR